MPYISELLNNQISDSSDAVVGKLQDILIAPPEEGSFEPLEFLVVKTLDGQIKFVPYGYVANFTTSQISLKNLFNKIALDQLPDKQFVYLRRDVLDQQIVDIAGTRVVRVDDLRIGIFDRKMSVLAIDASMSGLLRRLGKLGGLFSWMFKVHLIDWRQAQLLGGGGVVKLNIVAENLSHLHPADLANIVEDLDVQQGSGLLTSLSEKEAAKVFEELDPEWQNILLKYLGPEKAGKILQQMPADEFVDLVKTFSEPEAREFLSTMKNGKAKGVEKLLAYPNNTAGGLMTLEYVAARPDWLVSQTIEQIKKLSDSYRSIVFVYVTNEDGKFLGVVSLRRLLAAAPDMQMEKLVKTLEPYAVLEPTDKMRKIISLMTRYNLYTAAVVDKEGKLAGIVTIDDVMRHLYPSA